MQKLESDGKIIIKEGDKVILIAEKEDGRAVLNYPDGFIISNEVVPEGLNDIVRSKTPYSITLKFLDVSIGIHADSLEVIESLRKNYEGFSTDLAENLLDIYAMSSGIPGYENGMPMHLFVPNYRKFPRLNEDFSPVQFYSSMEHFYHFIDQMIEVFFITNSQEYMFMHAATVEKDGKVAIFPAISHSGKTTIAVGLMNRGWHLYSDEFAVIDVKSNRIHSFPRSVAIREGTLNLFPEMKNRIVSSYTVESYEGECDLLYMLDTSMIFPESNGTGVPQVMIFPNYVPGAEPSIKKIPASIAIQRLIGEKNFLSFGFRDKSIGLDILANLMRTVKCYDLVSGDIEKTLNIIEDTVG